MRPSDSSIYAGEAEENRDKHDKKAEPAREKPDNNKENGDYHK